MLAKSNVVNIEVLNERFSSITRCSTTPTPCIYGVRSVHTLTCFHDLNFGLKMSSLVKTVDRMAEQQLPANTFRQRKIGPICAKGTANCDACIVNGFSDAMC
ncbi:unnamed protein product, partial [Mesorhabditis belari]|uniref:Uncharacterized protein n=1 Tax=Mesorhabditis belari TaxID=2138241 RepID=A0AAF3ELU4_9BILA